MSKPIRPESVEARGGSSYPECFHERVLPRVKRALGDAFGLTRIGINHTTLGPGKHSALRHCHSDEDEFVYVISGTLTLINDDGEQPLSAGMVVGFAAGDGNAHQLRNDGSDDAVYLEVSNRSDADKVNYPDDDLCLDGRDAQGRWRFTHKDGTVWE